MIDTCQASPQIRRVGSCSECESLLPLRLTLEGEEAALWGCARCGVRYVGVIDESSDPHLRKNVVSHDESLPSPVGPPRQPAVTLSSVLPERSGVRASITTTASRRFALEIERSVDLTTKSDGPAFSERVKRHGNQSYDPGNVESAVSVVGESYSQLTDLLKGIDSGQGADPEGAEAVAHQCLRTAAVDLDLFVALGINPFTRNHPASHSVHRSMLAMSMGATLGLDQRTLVELGTGCLLHDAGMLKIGRKMWQSDRLLTSDDFRSVAAHPIQTLEVFSPYLDRIPVASQMVAYQMHELLDGSGYPHGYKDGKIHELAKIAAVADVFVALVSDRPYRRPMTPYLAMEKLVRGVQGGLFDGEAVRALLRTVSLFPLGSYVSLNDGRVGRVFRTNGDNYTLPIVEAWKPGRYNDVPETVDLSRSGDLEIEKPLVSLPAS